jgi:hypothetical protein
VHIGIAGSGGGADIREGNFDIKFFIILQHGTHRERIPPPQVGRKKHCSRGLIGKGQEMDNLLMSRKALDRLAVIQRLSEKRMSQ